MRRLGLLWLMAGSALCAEELPLWEVGVSVGALHTPHYLGAAQSDTYVLPLPYFVYRGSYVRADRGGIRGLLYSRDRLELRLSLGGALPVKSDDNDARAGMNDLDLLLEAGPNLQYTFYEDPRQLWRLDLPVQAVFSVGDRLLYHRGWTSSPRLHYQREVGRWTVAASLGPVFGDTRYHRYFYEVQDQYVTAERPRYDAVSGYTGARAGLEFKRRTGDWFIGSYFRYYDLSGASNRDSPLLKEPHYFSVGLFVAWILGESSSAAVWEADSALE